MLGFTMQVKLQIAAMCQSQQRSSEASVAAEVAAMVEQMMGKAVDPDQPLMEAGLDSLGAVELRSVLAQRFNLELPATITFDYPSAASLSHFLASQTTANLAVSTHTHTHTHCDGRP